MSNVERGQNSAAEKDTRIKIEFELRESSVDFLEKLAREKGIGVDKLLELITEQEAFRSAVFANGDVFYLVSRTGDYIAEINTPSMFDADALNLISPEVQRMRGEISEDECKDATKRTKRRLGLTNHDEII